MVDFFVVTFGALIVWGYAFFILFFILHLILQVNNKHYNSPNGLTVLAYIILYTAFI